jgi:hypothetical protein
MGISIGVGSLPVADLDGAAVAAAREGGEVDVTPSSGNEMGTQS